MQSTFMDLGKKPLDQLPSFLRDYKEQTKALFDDAPNLQHRSRVRVGVPCLPVRVVERDAPLVLVRTAPQLQLGVNLGLGSQPSSPYRL